MQNYPQKDRLISKYWGMRRPPSKLEKSLSKRLKELRGEASQVQFARKLGIAQSTLNRIEGCEQSVTLHMLEQIADRMKVSVQILLGL